MPDNRTKLDAFVRELAMPGVELLPDDSVFDYHYDVSDGRWRPWLSLSDFFAAPLHQRSCQIVRTPGSVTTAYMSRLLQGAQRPLLVLGESSTGRAGAIVEGVANEPVLRIPLTWSTHAEVLASRL